MSVHFCVDLFSIIMLIIIYCDNYKAKGQSLDRKVFREMILTTFAVLVADIVKWIPVGTDILPMWFLWNAAFVYVGLAPWVSAVWCYYVCVRVYGSRQLFFIKKRVLPWVVAALSAYVFFAISAPFNRLLFYLEPDGTYCRGELYYIIYIFTHAFTLASMLLSFKYWRTSDSAEKRRECAYLTGYAVIPLVGELIQHYVPEWWIGMPSVAIVILIVYVNILNRQVITDGLTGLNNRREFDNYLTERLQQSAETEIGMLMIDMDRFKEINDTYGHVVGDEALWEAADILRNVFGGTTAFLARYGGDEFAVILNCRTEEEILQAIDAILEAVQQHNDNSQKPYRLSFSIGYALLGEVERKSIHGLTEKADARMYEQKARKKECFRHNISR